MNKLVKENASFTNKLQNMVNGLMAYQKQLLQIRIWEIEATSDVETLEAQQQDTINQLEAKRRQVEERM